MLYAPCANEYPVLSSVRQQCSRGGWRAFVKLCVRELGECERFPENFVDKLQSQCRFRSINFENLDEAFLNELTKFTSEVRRHTQSAMAAELGSPSKKVSRQLLLNSCDNDLLSHAKTDFDNCVDLMKLIHTVVSAVEGVGDKWRDRPIPDHIRKELQSCVFAFNAGTFGVAFDFLTRKLDSEFRRHHDKILRRLQSLLSESPESHVEDRVEPCNYSMVLLFYARFAGRKMHMKRHHEARAPHYGVTSMCTFPTSLLLSSGMIMDEGSIEQIGKLRTGLLGKNADSVSTDTAVVAAELFLRLTNPSDEFFGRFVGIAKWIIRRSKPIEPVKSD